MVVVVVVHLPFAYDQFVGKTQGRGDYGEQLEKYKEIRLRGERGQRNEFLLKKIRRWAYDSM